MWDISSRGNKYVLFPLEWQQRWKMKLREERREGANENLSAACKSPLNCPEAMDDFARPLTPHQRLKHEAELPRMNRGGKMVALMLWHKCYTYGERNRKWTEMKVDRRGWWPVKYRRRKQSEGEEYFKRWAQKSKSYQGNSRHRRQQENFAGFLFIGLRRCFMKRWELTTDTGSAIQYQRTGFVAT